jgi:hypothetical protein
MVSPAALLRKSGSFGITPPSRQRLRIDRAIFRLIMQVDRSTFFAAAELNTLNTLERDMIREDREAIRSPEQSR